MMITTEPLLAADEDSRRDTEPAPPRHDSEPPDEDWGTRPDLEIHEDDGDWG